MTVIAGCQPDGASHAVMHLAAMLARSAGEPVVACAVVPVQGTARAEPRATARARETLDAARAAMPDDIDTSYVVREDRSISAALLGLAVEHHADLIVVGSSSASALGHVAFGGVPSRLLHGSPVPVALAPKGFRSQGRRGVDRVTAAYDGSDGQIESVLAAAALAAQLGAPLRLAAFAIRIPPPYTTRLGTEGDIPVAAQWVSDMGRATAAACRRIAELPDAPDTVESTVGFGRTAAEALEDVDWGPNEILTIGSSRTGPFARILLGSRGAQLARHSPVPVVVVPRAAAPPIDGRAERVRIIRPR
ncbi:universal stress protein [Nocardia sp. NPDC051570]|uniref:universal stress protein n=1 Tax=Nocardia sp. NPDC051570 TaxID=3364324 RepID=UPI003791861D